MSDGEFGKTFRRGRGTSATASRASRSAPSRRRDLVGPQDPSRLGEDRRDYAEFYDDYFRRNPVASGVREHGLAVCVGPIRYAGQDGDRSATSPT